MDRAAGEDVRSQAAPMNQRPEQPGPRELLEMGTRLGQAPSDALRCADAKASPDERVQRDAARDDVPARLFPREVDLFENLGLDERQLVAAARTAERPASECVPVAFET